MRETMECFKRLCDEVVILCNNCDQAEIDLIDEYGFKRFNDRREWGSHQWRIKQDFIERDIKQIANEGDVLVCLDMDEVLSERCTKEWLLESPLDAYHVFIVDLWNDPQHFKPESCFWNVRIWKWNGETKFKAKPVHCGLAPEWTYHYHRHAPFLLLHKGLMDEETRLRKIKRYEKYDPNAEHLDQKYYDMLRSNTARPFDETAMADQIAEEVAAYKQVKPRETTMTQPKPRFAYVKNPHGDVIDIPEKHLDMTLKRPGFEFINWADEEQEEIESMFEDDEVGVIPGATPHPTSAFSTDVSTEALADHIGQANEMVGDKPVEKNNYGRSPADEKAELDALNAKDDMQLAGFSAPVQTPVDTEEVDAMFNEDEDTVSGEAITLTNENVGEMIQDAKDAIDSKSEPKPDTPAQKPKKVTAPKKTAAAPKKK